MSAPQTNPPLKQPQFSSPEEKKHVDSLKLQKSEDIISAIKAYRRAKGLCYKCGVKWGPGHKCAPTVDLHVVEELWQMLQNPNHLPQVDPNEDSDSSDELMALSAYAVAGIEAPKTIRLIGNLQGLKPLILLDSGSSSTFISEQMAALLPNCLHQFL